MNDQLVTARHCASQRRIGAFLLLLGFVLVQFAGAEGSRIPVGAARVDITPDYAIRLSGYAVRRTPSDGTAQHLVAKALSIGSAQGGNLTLIITVDNLGLPGPMTEKIYERIAAQVKLPREQFAICASHTHTAPMLSGIISNLFGMDIPNEQWA